MDFTKKEQTQTAGDNSKQQQIGTQYFYQCNIYYNDSQPAEGATAVSTADEHIDEQTIEGYNTSLWKRTLGKNNRVVRLLKDSYLSARENVRFLLEKIKSKPEFSEMIVPDIQNIDSLWKITDTIIGKDYEINPLEGYILGVAFLIHDVALSYEIVGSIKKLRETIEWEAAHADGSNGMNEDEFMKECDFTAIRFIHVRKVAGILKETFCRDNGTTFHIVNESITIRNGNNPILISLDAYNELIGKIATSHYRRFDDIKMIFRNQVAPLNELPWSINEQKLACVFRCAYAGHIDNGHVPETIISSLNINGVSRSDWVKHKCLGQVLEDVDDKTKIRITSIKSFNKKEYAVWNVAYDAVKLFDEELKKSNELLKSANLSFPHIGVSGAESKEALSVFIEPKGWKPCSFGVHTSNVKALIKNLGGSKLYGKDNLLLVTLRELIQNSRDAIQARRILDGHPEEGRITIRFIEKEGKRLIEVQDNGIGMSLDCIKDHLLDFGSSYWRSDTVKSEYRGLRSKGFNPIGKYGIGFYSIFMVATSVEVITRKYTDGEKANKIEFPEGLTLSPILSIIDQSTNVSTLVRFELNGSIQNEYKIGEKTFVPLQKAVSLLTAGLDVDVYYECGNERCMVHENIKSPNFDKAKWLKGLFVYCPDNINDLASNIEILRDEMGEIRGLILPPECISQVDFPSEDSLKQLPCFKTIGGLLSSSSLSSSFMDNGYIGFLDGFECNISRNKMFLDKPLKRCLQEWTKKKYRKICYEIFNNGLGDLTHYYYKLIKFCGIDDDEIIKENIRWFFSTEQYIPMSNMVGTMKCLMKIHLYLTAGIDQFAGKFFYTKDRVVNEYSYQIDGLFDMPNSNFDDVYKILESTGLRFKKECVKIFMLLYVNRMPITTYEEIIDKFCMLYHIQPFKNRSFETLCVWVNLLLNRLNNQMIDWNRIDDSIMESIIKNAYSDVYDYLYQTLEDNRNESSFMNKSVKKTIWSNSIKKIKPCHDDVILYLNNYLVPSSEYLAKISASQT